MTITPIQLFDPQLLTTDLRRLYQAPLSSIAVVVKYLEIHNTGSEPVDVTINMVPRGGEPSLANQLYSKPVAGKQSVTVSSAINYNLGYSASIYASAGVDAVISIHGSGTLVT
jgi:hypothetical protein